MRSFVPALTLVCLISGGATAHAQLLHHLTFDETTGLVASDRGCRGNGTLVGFDNDDDAQWVEGQFGGALDLGSDEFLDNRVTLNLDATNGGEAGFTVAMWIKPGEQIGVPGEYQLLSTPGDVVGFTIMNFANDTVTHDRVLLFWDGNLPNLHVGTTTLEADTWYHVAITSTGVGGEKLYYVDGVLEEQALFLPDQGGTEGMHPGNVDGWPGGAGQIGAIGNGARTHDTVIDDLRIFDSALSADDIAALLTDEPLPAPVISNLNPEDGELQHSAAAGLTFDVEVQADGASLADENIKLFLNGEDVSAGLSFGGPATAREVEFTGLEADSAYSARIEATDSNGSTACRSFTFATLETALDGLVHHFRMDETSGLTAVDLGSARNGTLFGFEADDDSQWVSAVCDNGLDLGSDGTINNYVEFNAREVNALDSGGFTVSMWVNLGEQILTPGEYQLLSTPGDVVGFTVMNFDGEERHDRVLLFWDGILPDLHVGTTSLEPGAWYHVAITSTGFGGEKLYYLDGELEEQTLFLPSQGGVEGQHPANRDGWAEGIARLGAIGAGNRAHDSILDDVRIYDRALEEDEILDVIAECPPPCDPLELSDLAPQSGDSFYDPNAGIELEVATPNDGFGIAEDGITMIVNGADVSGDLTIGGTPATRTVRYAGLQADTAYSVEISVTDGCAELSRSLTFGTFSQCEEAVEDGLVHYWKLDETTGFSAFDCVGGSIASLSGIDVDDDSQWTTGVQGGALDFGNDGTLDNLFEAPIQGVNALDTGGFTVAMWIRPGDQILTPGEYQLLATPGDAVGFTIMNFDGEERHDRVLLFWDGSLPDLHVGTTTLEPGAWYHVAITSTGFGGEKLYFLNGQPEEQVLFLPAQGGVEGNHVATRNGWNPGIGRVGSIGAARFHDTVFDEIRIYERALELDDIAALASVQPGGQFDRGDSNSDGEFNIADAIFILNSLFTDLAADPTCDDAADANDDGAVNIADGIFILNRLFGEAGAPPPEPFGNCGSDPTDDDLDCAESTAGC